LTLHEVGNNPLATTAVCGSMEFIKSQRVNKKVVCESVKQKELANGVTNYECVKRSFSNCHVKVKMCGCKIVGHLNSNTHAAYPRRLETLRVQGKMKRISISILETTQQMILSASETL